LLKFCGLKNGIKPKHYSNQKVHCPQTAHLSVSTLTNNPKSIRAQHLTRTMYLINQHEFSRHVWFCLHSLRLCTHRTNHGEEQSELWPWCPTPNINTNDELNTSTYISTYIQHNTERHKTLVSKPILGNDLRSRPPGHGETHFLTIRFRLVPMIS
jgi:hypothetical protein